MKPKFQFVVHAKLPPLFGGVRVSSVPCMTRKRAEVIADDLRNRDRAEEVVIEQRARS